MSLKQQLLKQGWTIQGYDKPAIFLTRPTHIWYLFESMDVKKGSIAAVQFNELLSGPNRWVLVRRESFKSDLELMAQTEDPVVMLAVLKLQGLV